MTTKHQKKSVIQQFYMDAPNITGNEYEKYHSGIEEFAYMCNEAVYVIDFFKRCFSFVSSHDLFLCGHKVKDVLSLGYDFYPEVIHPDDLPLLKKYHAEILRLCIMNKLDGIKYFSFAIRIKFKAGYLTVNHKLKPVFIDGQIRYGTCLLSISAIDTNKRLCACFENSTYVYEYSLDNRKWQKKTVQPLTNREKKILMLLIQGETYKYIYDKLCISIHTLRNEMVSIFDKLRVHDKTQAVLHATNNSQIFFSIDDQPSDKQEMKEEFEKKVRRQMTPDKLLRIQEKLDNGQSKNSIASQEGVSEFTIRYHFKIGKLKKISRDDS